MSSEKVIFRHKYTVDVVSEHTSNAKLILHWGVTRDGKPWTLPEFTLPPESIMVPGAA